MLRDVGLPCLDFARNDIEEKLLSRAARWKPGKICRCSRCHGLSPRRREGAECILGRLAHRICHAALDIVPGLLGIRPTLDRDLDMIRLIDVASVRSLAVAREGGRRPVGEAWRNAPDGFLG